MLALHDLAETAQDVAPSVGPPAARPCNRSVRCCHSVLDVQIKKLTLDERLEVALELRRQGLPWPLGGPELLRLVQRDTSLNAREEVLLLAALEIFDLVAQEAPAAEVPPGLLRKHTAARTPSGLRFEVPVVKMMGVSES